RREGVLMRRVLHPDDPRRSAEHLLPLLDCAVRLERRLRTCPEQVRLQRTGDPDRQRRGRLPVLRGDGRQFFRRLLGVGGRCHAVWHLPRQRRRQRLRSHRDRRSFRVAIGLRRRPGHLLLAPPRVRAASEVTLQLMMLLARLDASASLPCSYTKYHPCWISWLAADRSG